jgi:hypothetical protein
MEKGERLESICQAVISKCRPRIELKNSLECAQYHRLVLVLEELFRVRDDKYNKMRIELQMEMHKLIDKGEKMEDELQRIVEYGKGIVVNSKGRAELQMEMLKLIDKGKKTMKVLFLAELQRRMERIIDEWQRIMENLKEENYG